MNDLKGRIGKLEQDGGLKPTRCVILRFRYYDTVDGAVRPINLTYDNTQSIG